MDEDDSQDEQINRNVSQGKGKRPAMSIVSDDEDNSEGGGETEEGETDSEEDVSVEENLDGQEEEEEEDDSDDEVDGQALEGAVGDVTADAMDLSSDEDSEKCPICLNSFHEQPVATPEACEHYFCLDCILEWSNNANSCPVDRKVFNNILLRKCHGGKVQKTIAVQKPVKPGQEEQVNLDLDQTCCEVCGGRDREDRLLLCDGCDAGYHMECLTPPLDAVPVEEWFCPECIANNRSSGSDHVSEEESSLPTTSHSRTRPTRAIARTQHSERVRANVNRRRITQARTAAEFAPRYLMQSTWLDETINAVVGGLNTAVYVRDLTPRVKHRRRRKTAKRRKTSGKSLSASGGKTTLGVRRRKRKVRKSKSRRKLVVKKDINSRGRIARSLGIKKPRGGSLIPSVYRPSENSLGSMRAEIGAASLSVYGDPFDLDPFDDREEEIQVPTPLSVLDAKRRGLSRSALRSHQPVARPITAGLSRRGVSISHTGDVAAETPVSDLLGSILSGQSMLLMDSSDVVINRDGSLKATKPVCLSLPSSSTSRGSSSGEAATTPNSETSPFHNNGGAGPSSSPLRRPSSAQTSPGPCFTPQNPASPCPPISSPQLPHLSSGHPRLHPGPSPGLVALNPQRPGNGIRESNNLSDVQHHDKGSTGRQPPVKKPPPKPVWVDVSILPRIPKIKKEGTSSTSNNNSNNRGSSSNSLPESSTTSLAGNTGREHTVEQQGTSSSQPNRTNDTQMQRHNRTGASTSFSNSFTSTTSSHGASSNSRPSSSSSVSFRISSSGNPWHTRRLPASGETSPGNNRGTVKKNDKSKQMLLTLKSQFKEVKREVYDPFNPTGSDSSDSEPENEVPDMSTPNVESRVPVGANEDVYHPIKSEPVELDMEGGSELCPRVKNEPDCFRDTAQIQKPLQGGVEGLSRIDLDRSGTNKKSEELSDSSLTCNVEIKSEPKGGPPPVNPQSSFLSHQSFKGNRVCKELHSISAPLNATNIAQEDKTSHKSQSKDGRRSASSSPSPPKDVHKKKHSSSKEKRRSRSKSRDRQHSKSKQKQRSRSRSKDRKHRRSRDSRCSSSSSSRERKTCQKSPEKSDCRGRERRRKGSKENKHSRSRSFSRSRSRSRERRRTSKDRTERSKRAKSRSRSTSRERKKREDLLKDRSSLKTELKTECGVYKIKTPSKREKDSRGFVSKSTVLLQPVKQEVRSEEIPTHYFGSSSLDDKTKLLIESKKEDSSDVSNELKTFNVKEIKQVKLAPIFEVKEIKDIKKEEELNTCEETELDTVKQLKKETLSSPEVFNEKSESNEIKSDAVDFGKTKAYNPDDETKAKEMIVEPKRIKVEQIWPDDEDSPCCSDNPLVISLDTPDVDSDSCKKESMDVSPMMDEIEVTSEVPIKLEPADTSDEDINVDYLIDNLDFIKKEMNESSAAESTDTVDPKCAAEEAPSENKEISETVVGGVKSKSQGKRVTWNLQEPEAPSSEKLSKIALFKLKLKQESLRRSTLTQQTSSQEKAQAEQKLTANVSSPLSQDDSGRRKSHKEKVSKDLNQKEKYIKKLHMQERAIEEVKLAIKPFYQKRDITKEEYKEILRKAVQKVCHSKSGEINPLKVANLVKAYVDKFKHARKHKKEDSEQCQHTDTKNVQVSP